MAPTLPRACRVMPSVEIRVGEMRAAVAAPEEIGARTALRVERVDELLRILGPERLDGVRVGRELDDPGRPDKGGAVAAVEEPVLLLDPREAGRVALDREEHLA